MILGTNKQLQCDYDKSAKSKLNEKTNEAMDLLYAD